MYCTSKSQGLGEIEPPASIDAGVAEEGQVDEGEEDLGDAEDVEDALGVAEVVLGVGGHFGGGDGVGAV